MRKGITETTRSSSATYEALEEMVRGKVQEYIQTILEEEVETFLGRKKSERLKMVDGAGYRNGHGKPKKFAVMNGTITVPRPRVRGTEERFESKIQRRVKRVPGLNAWLVDSVFSSLCKKQDLPHFKWHHFTSDTKGNYPQ
jgi:transposase-like protein